MQTDYLNLYFSPRQRKLHEEVKESSTLTILEVNSMKKFTFFLQDISSSWLARRTIIWYQYGNVWGHTGIVLNWDAPDFDRTCPLVAEAGNKIQQGYKPVKGLRYFQIDVTDEQDKIIQQSTQKYMGEEYDTTGLLSFVLRLDVDNPNKLFCSEYVAQVLKDAGIELFRPGTMEPWMMAPYDLIKSTLVTEV